MNGHAGRTRTNLLAYALMALAALLPDEALSGPP
jgi:hypothetical protein